MHLPRAGNSRQAPRNECIHYDPQLKHVGSVVLVSKLGRPLFLTALSINLLTITPADVMDVQVSIDVQPYQLEPSHKHVARHTQHKWPKASHEAKAT